MNKTTIFTAIIMLGVGLGVGYLYSPDSSIRETGTTVEMKPLYYRNPMNPTVTSPVPAKDNMGMDYIPVYANDKTTAGKPGTVAIDPKVIQSIGVRTAVATKKDLSVEIQTTGRVAYDEDRLYRLHPKISGWIEKLFFGETGSVVKPGDMLLSVYSPRLVSTQEEYLLALKNAEILADSPFTDIRQGAQDLLKSTQERLELLDVPEHQIRELTQNRKIMKALHIHSQAGGIILNIGAREGQHVTPQTELYMIADLTRIWTYVDIYEYELPWVQLHDKTTMRLDAYPGRIFEGEVTYIYPYIDPRTRTNKVRLEFDNPDLALKPDMFANVTLQARRSLNGIVVPTEAVIRTGKNPKVFVEVSHGSFEPRDVRLGSEANDETLILSGVAEGERVVTSSQFLIDSESSLVEAAAKMMAPENEPQNDDTHAGMESMNMDMDMSKDMDMNQDMDMSKDMDMNREDKQ